MCHERGKEHGFKYLQSLIYVGYIVSDLEVPDIILSLLHWLISKSIWPIVSILTADIKNIDNKNDLLILILISRFKTMGRKLLLTILPSRLCGN